jgi:hypothetical protein
MLNFENIIIIIFEILILYIVRKYVLSLETSTKGMGKGLE